MVESIDAPAQDRFQIVTEHSAADLIYDPAYLGVDRSGDIVIIQITMSFGRRPPQKRKLFERIVEILSVKPGVRPQDLMINLVETAWENWSFGNGEAQYTK
jgi:hypothetical protein